MQVSLLSSVHINMIHCASVELNDLLNRDKGWSWSLCLKLRGIAVVHYKVNSLLILKHL